MSFWESQRATINAAGGAEICHWGFTAKTKDDRSVKLSEGLVSCWVWFEDDILAWDGSTSSDRVKGLGPNHQVR
jgi:hypothetical protein